MRHCAMARIPAALENIQPWGLPTRIVCHTTHAMEPNERLKSWIAAAKISNAEMARRVQYDKANFHRILNGDLRPTIDLALRIERETGGTIPMAAWARDIPAEQAA